MFNIANIEAFKDELFCLSNTISINIQGEIIPPSKIRQYLLPIKSKEVSIIHMGTFFDILEKLTNIYLRQEYLLTAFTHLKKTYTTLRPVK